MEFIDKKINEELNRELGMSAYEMATVGFFQERKGNKPKGGLIKVFVTDDSGKPQVHVHLKGINGEINSCIKLDAPEYFLHDTAKDKLSKEQINGLIQFFKQKSAQPTFVFNNETYKLRTQWDYAIIQWNVENQINPKVWIKIGKDKEGYIISPPMPDYSKLK